MTEEIQLENGCEPFPGYRLGHRIGRGGFAEVWDALGPDGDTVALKCMPLKTGAVASKEVRSIRELGQLIHPHLTRVYQVWCLPGYIIIAMELAEGSLHDLFVGYWHEYKSAIPPEELCRYLTQAANAIDFLNSRVHAHGTRQVGYQHCDIKPSNILLFGENVRLADYGLATPISKPVNEYDGGGTIDFAAPEMFRGRLSDRSDQFSLAATYAFLRTGQLPFPNMPRRFDPHFVHPAPDLSALMSAERAVIARAMSPEPTHRWPSCSLMMARLSKLFEPITRRGWSGFDTLTD